MAVTASSALKGALLGSDPLSNKDGNVDLKVIGAGCGRTGTSSLRIALEKLYEGKCYHMQEIIDGGRFNEWLEITSCEDPERHRELLGKALHGYVATVDFPTAVYFKEQLKLFPDAKVILSVRDPESWYKSVIETIHGPLSPAEAWYVWIIPPLRTFKKFCRNYKKDWFLGEPVRSFEDKDAWVAAFKAWNQHVKDSVPSGQLLVWEASDGWAPLCKFLGTAVPDEPFPHLNDTKALRAEFSKIKVVCLGLHCLLAAFTFGAIYGVFRLAA